MDHSLFKLNLHFCKKIKIVTSYHKCHARTTASREQNFETEHCGKLWKQDIYLEIRYLRKIPAFLVRLWFQPNPRLFTVKYMIDNWNVT